MKAAVIFVCSDDVGPYINVLFHLEDKRSISSFTFVFLTGVMNEGPQTAFVDSITEALEDLGGGMYKGGSVNISPDVRSRYNSLAQSLRSRSDLAVSITMEQLRDLLKQQQDAAKPDSLVIDVTGLPKTLMAHVLLICVYHGYSAHTFELRNKPNRKRPDLSLCHSLSPSDFTYADLTRDPAVLTSVRQLIPARHIALATAAVIGIGVACFSVLLITSPENGWLEIIGLAANVLGISGGILQIASARNGL